MRPALPAPGTSGIPAAATVERDGRTWSAPLDYWGIALDEMLEKRDRLSLPLKSHGYLIEIVCGLSNKAEGSAEQKQEASRAYAYSRTVSASGGLERVKPPAEFLELVAKMRGKGAPDEDKS